jgi:hypothetical protein
MKTERVVPLCEIPRRFEPVFVTGNMRGCKSILGSQRNPLDIYGRPFIEALASEIANDLPAQYQQANGSAGTSSPSNTVNQVNAIASREAQSPKGLLNIGRPSPSFFGLSNHRAPLSCPSDRDGPRTVLVRAGVPAGSDCTRDLTQPESFCLAVHSSALLCVGQHTL